MAFTSLRSQSPGPNPGRMPFNLPSPPELYQLSKLSSGKRRGSFFKTHLLTTTWWVSLSSEQLYLLAHKLCDPFFSLTNHSYRAKLGCQQSGRKFSLEMGFIKPISTLLNQHEAAKSSN